MRQADIALAYARKGISVFPCKQDKSPATTNGFSDATLDEAQIKRWWRKNPNFLIGSPNSNFTVLDIDDQNLCVSGKMLTENALFRLFADVVPEGVVTVTTMSGGRHFYFKQTPNVRRRINALPNIDLLGEGGFVILPDQKKYKANVPLWDNLEGLPLFPKEKFDALSKELEAARRLARNLKKSHKKGVAPKSDGSKVTPDFTELPKDLEEMVAEEKNREGVNYKTGVMHFTQTPDMYKKNTKYEADYSILEKYKDGVLDIGAGELNTARINALFHYPPIQYKLGKMLGLDVPESQEQKTLMHSILPGHPDVRQSMGVRWSADGSHLLIRDFSNHFSDVYDQLDYNVVRLYATMRYKTLVPRMKAPEFVVWFLRMMVDAGIIKITKLRKKYAMPRFGGNGIWKVAEGLITLDAIKQLYSGYDHTTTYADRFCAAWCGVDPSAANRAKKALHEGGYIYIDGVIDCSGGARTDGFYNTKVMSIMDKAKITAINKSTENLAKETTMAEKQHMTLRGYSISEQSYTTIKNFCSDYKIEEVPIKKNMFVETTTLAGLVQADTPESDSSFVMNDLRLVVAPSMTGSGNVLMIVGECEELEELFWKEVEDLSEENSVVSDEPMIGFVICSDYNANALDIETLELKIKDYLNDQVILDTFFVRYTTSDALFGDIFDGREPEGE